MLLFGTLLALRIVKVASKLVGDFYTSYINQCVMWFSPYS